MIIIVLLAFAAGGYVAGRVSGSYRYGRGFLHGLLTWGVLVLVGAWLLTSAAGMLLGGIGNVLGSGLNMVGQGMGALAPAISENIEQATADLDLSAENIRGQLSDLLLEGTRSEERRVG